jgi:hypothetical protein
VAFNYNPAMMDLYGISTGDVIAAEYLNPEKATPLVRKKFEAAQASTLAQRAGYGPLGLSEAERLAQTGVSGQQETQGFGALAAQKELFAPLDAGESAISRSSQLGAAFEGDAQAKADIQARQRRRQAAFNQGGTFATNAQGFAGAK